MKNASSSSTVISGKVTEFERFQEVTVGSELKMIDLKRNLERVKKRLGEVERSRP